MNSTIKHLPKCINKLHKTILPIKGIGSYIYSLNPNKIHISKTNPFINNNIPTEYLDKYLDFTGGIGALSTGHCHPLITEYVSKQLNNVVHVPQQVFGTHEPQSVLTNKLIDILPGDLDTIFYTSSGSESNDNAIKIARRYTEKTNIISVNKGFHGRTLGTLSLTSSNIACKYKCQPLIPGVFFMDPTKKAFDSLLSYHTSPNETAALILEPVQGEGGIFSLSTEFLKYVREKCTEYNIILIADEVQCGMGRTGTWWNVEQKEIIPDILTFGKGISSGFPLAGMAMNNKIINQEPGFLGGTYGGNAICSAAAIATIDIIKNENLLDNSNFMGKILKEELTKSSKVKEVRQYGLMIAIEFKEHVNSNDILSRLRNKRILVLLAGNNNQYIRLLPPLNISIKEVYEFINIFTRL